MRAANSDTKTKTKRKTKTKTKTKMKECWGAGLKRLKREGW